MRYQRGFVGLIILLIAVVVLLFVMASYTDVLTRSSPLLPKMVPVGEQGGEPVKAQLVMKKSVEVTVIDTKSGKVDTGALGFAPFVVFDYRISLLDSDYLSVAEILVENASDGVYQKVELGKDDSIKVGKVRLTVTKFNNSP